MKRFSNRLESDIKSIVRNSVVLFLSLLLSEIATAESIVSGNYESLDGKFRHIFLRSGEYSGSVKISDGILSGFGVYEQGDGYCWQKNSDGTKGALGNVILYVDEVQCCLEFRRVSDKFAVTKIWVTGTGTGYRLCKNQVLKKKSSE